MTSTNIDDILAKCPNVPKYNSVDEYAFNNQYDKCIQIVDILHDYLVVNKKKLVSEQNIKYIGGQIDQFYKLSELVNKTKQVIYKINCIDQFRRIIGIINSVDGCIILKTFYNSLSVDKVSSEKPNKIGIK